MVNTNTFCITFFYSTFCFLQPKAKGKGGFSSDDDEDFAPLSERVEAQRMTTGRMRKPVSYKMDDSDFDSD